MLMEQMTFQAPPKAVTIGDQNTIKANIFAPNGTIQINERTSVDGALIGKDVYIGDKVKVTMYNGFLGQSLTCDINAEPETITMGESTTLSWVSANATTAEIDQG